MWITGEELQTKGKKYGWDMGYKDGDVLWLFAMSETGMCIYYRMSRAHDGTWANRDPAKNLPGGKKQYDSFAVMRDDIKIIQEDPYLFLTINMVL